MSALPSRSHSVLYASLAPSHVPSPWHYCNITVLRTTLSIVRLRTFDIDASSFHRPDRPYLPHMLCLCYSPALVYSSCPLPFTCG